MSKNPYEESLVVLVKAAPAFSKKLGYVICTGGINEKGEWRRLYPILRETMIKQNIRVWDQIIVRCKKAEDDPRPESYKVKNLENMGQIIESRRERRKFIEEHLDRSLDAPVSEKRTMALIKPILFDFDIVERKQEVNQADLYGGIFKSKPYGDIGIFYKFKCQEPCSVCKGRGKFHHMECFDWGVNYLYRKYPEESVAREKVREMCFTKMKFDYDSWFVLGTHSSYPFLKWLLVGLLWMKKEEKIPPTEEQLGMERFLDAGMEP